MSDITDIMGMIYSLRQKVRLLQDDMDRYSKSDGEYFADAIVMTSELEAIEKELANTTSHLEKNYSLLVCLERDYAQWQQHSM